MKDTSIFQGEKELTKNDLCLKLELNNGFYKVFIKKGNTFHYQCTIERLHKESNKDLFERALSIMHNEYSGY